MHMEVSNETLNERIGIVILSEKDSTNEIKIIYKSCKKKFLIDQVASAGGGKQTYKDFTMKIPKCKSLILDYDSSTIRMVSDGDQKTKTIDDVSLYFTVLDVAEAHLISNSLIKLTRYGYDKAMLTMLKATRKNRWRRKSGMIAVWQIKGYERKPEWQQKKEKADSSQWFKDWESTRKKVPARLEYNDPVMDSLSGISGISKEIILMHSGKISDIVLWEEEKILGIVLGGKSYYNLELQESAYNEFHAAFLGA